jgi:hypothetical protein
MNYIFDNNEQTCIIACGDASLTVSISDGKLIASYDDGKEKCEICGGEHLTQHCQQTEEF